MQALLDERFITQAELAEYLRVHERNVSRWVRNETGPQKRRLREIAEFFGVEPASLIESDAGSGRGLMLSLLRSLAVRLNVAELVFGDLALEAVNGALEDGGA